MILVMVEHQRALIWQMELMGLARRSRHRSHYLIHNLLEAFYSGTRSWWVRLLTTSTAGQTLELVRSQIPKSRAFFTVTIAGISQPINYQALGGPAYDIRKPGEEAIGKR